MRYNPFQKMYSEQEEEMFTFLRKNFLFNSLTNRELHEFIPFLYPRNYEQNEVIFFRGDPSQALYLVREGSVLITIDMQDTFEELSELHTHGVFGENALLEGAMRVYNAVCSSEKCSLYVIPSSNLAEIFEGNTTIKAKMLEAMARYHNHYMTRLFAAYKASFGFFNLGMAYGKNY